MTGAMCSRLALGMTALLGGFAPAEAAPEPPVSAAASAPPMLTPVLPALAEAQGRLAGRLADLLHAPEEARSLLVNLAAWLATAEGVRAFAYVLILFIVAVGLEWLYWTCAFSALRAADIAEPSSPRQVLWLGLRRAMLKGVGLLLFAVAAIGVTTSFSCPGASQDCILTIVLVIVLLRLAGLVLRLLLAPGSTGPHILPLDDQTAANANFGALAVIALLVVGVFIPGSIERISDAHHFAQAVRLVAVTLAAGIVLAGIAAAARAAKPRRRTARRRLPPFPKMFFASVLVVTIYVLWLAGGGRLALTLAVVCLVVAAEGVLRPMVRFFWPTFGQPNSEFLVVPGLVLRLMRLLVACAGVAALILAWNLAIFQMSMTEGPAGRFATRLIGAVALLLVADFAWAAIKGAIDSRLRHIGPIPADGEAGPNARLVTLLPLLRTATAITLLTLLVLSILSVLGVEITPLLAGAGVIGIALGFGAQTLVRDVLSGVFYLVEDVFRIGEYIESGSSTKGTVERITLRSVALRHHNGPLHFVPYGVLGAVRNNSRDWIIEKFNLPLRVDVDSEFVRKLLKKIGEQMYGDPDLGPLMVEPMKAKLYRIDPGVKIFRCKIQTPPGKQFEIRTAAYKRIEAALKQAGIPFADNAARLIVPEAAEAAHFPGTVVRIDRPTESGPKEQVRPAVSAGQS
ncbi:MAG: mechanosensitive ion channel family protein [Methylobacteriaceae bacterium]|nr:mechanosensitive ion channel family protein [Methylobacteriaceae bacterium]